MRWIVAASLALVACGTTQSTQMVEVDNPPAKGAQPVEVREAQASGITVKLLEYGGGGLFELDVKNVGTQTLLVDRDAIEMITPLGERRLREPGGAATSYTIPPMSAHHVNVRYEMSTVQQGDVVRLDLTKALQLPGGATVPLTLAVRYY